MARFALFTNGVKVETLDELRENYNIKDIIENFESKKLHRWLAVNNFREELKKIESISNDIGDDLSDVLMECFNLLDEQKIAIKQQFENIRQQEISELDQIETLKFRTKFDVYLTNGCDEYKIKIIKEVRLITNCDLNTAKNIYESTPSLIVRDIDEDAACIIKNRIEQMGGSVSFTVSQHSNPSISNTEYDVVLLNYPDENKIALIKALRACTIYTDLKSAKSIAESAPDVTIARGVSFAAANLIQTILQDCEVQGAIAIKESGSLEIISPAFEIDFKSFKDSADFSVKYTDLEKKLLEIKEQCIQIIKEVLKKDWCFFESNLGIGFEDAGISYDIYGEICPLVSEKFQIDDVMWYNGYSPETVILSVMAQKHFEAFDEWGIGIKIPVLKEEIAEHIGIKRYELEYL